MFFSAMDLGWKRAHHLVIILIFLKHAVADEGWLSQNVQPQQNWPAHKHFSLGGIQSSVLEAPVTRSIPVEEVAPNMVPGKNLNAHKSRFSLSHQYVKGGSSSSYEPMSHTHSAPNVLDSTSLLKLLGSSSPSAQNIVRQDSYSWSPQDGSGLQGVSAQLASTPVRGGSSNSLSILSQSSSQSTPDSVKSLSPFDVSGLPTSDQSSSNMFTVSSQDRSGLQLGGASSQLASTGSSGISRRLFTATYQGSSGPQLAEGSSQLVSTSGLLTQPPSAESQHTSGSSYAKLVASPLGVSQSTSGHGSYSRYTSSSQSRVGTQLAASHQYVPGQGSDYGSSVQPQGTTSQYAPAFSLGAKKMSSQYHQATLSGSLSPSQSSKGWQPSIIKTQGFQGSSKAVSHGSGTSQSSIWSPSRFSSLQSQSTSSQNAPAPLGAKWPVYSQVAPSGSSLSPSQSSPWQTSSSWSKGFQTSGTVASRSNTLSQGSKAPSKFSTLTSAARPGHFASTQGSGKYSGFSLSQGTSSPYSPSSSGYTKLVASPLGVSQSTSGHGSYSRYTSSSQSRAGTQLAGSSHYAPGQTGNAFTDGSSLHLQGTSTQYVPAASSAKVPVYSQTAPSGSLSLSQPSQWQPSSSWSKGFQTSGTVASRSNTLSQGSKAPSKFSTLTSAARPGQFIAPQGSGRYSGLSSLSQGTSSQYSSGSPAYAKHGSSLEFSSQSTSDPSSSGLYSSSSQSRAGTQLAGSSSYVPAQTGSTFTGASFQFQGTSNQYAPSVSRQYTQASPSESSLTDSEAFRKWQSSASPWSKWFQASSTAVPQRSSSPQSAQTSSVSSFLPALSPSVDSVAQSSISSSRRNSVFGTGLGASKLSAQAASGSPGSSQIFPGLSASVHLSGSTTSSLGSSVQGALQGTFSGQSSDSTSLISSSYGQKASGSSRPSQSSFATGLYSSSVKG